MANATQYNWLVFCETEGSFQQWTNQKWRPITCPNSPDHVIDPTQSSYTLVLKPPNLLDLTINQGFFGGNGFSYTATAGTTTNYDLTYPYDVTILVGNILIEDVNQGDILNLTLQPNFIVGVLIQDANAGDTVIYPDNTTITALVKGVQIQINADGNYYVVQSVDVMNSAINLCSPLINDYTAGMYVDETIYVIENFLLPSKTLIEFGNLNPTSTVIPANYVFRFMYTNNGTVDKIFNFFLQCY